jgi:dihydropyrimidinase
MDVGIMNGKVYIDGEFFEENIYIKNGRIDTITMSNLPCKVEYDAKGKLILPGFIDPHVHFHLTVGANTSKDDFTTGSIQGALGGVTTYIDFLDPIKATREFEKAFQERMKLAKYSVTDYGFHTTIANPTDEPSAIMQIGRKSGICSVKLFTTYAETDRRTFDNYIDELLKYSKELASRIVIHAENDNMINHATNILIEDHEDARPAISERTEILKLAEVAKERDGLLYLVHVSAGSSVEALTKYYSKQLKDKNIILESCPHYFLLNRDYYKREDGYLYTMTPPLREEKERLLQRKHIEDFTVIATDHCPFEAQVKNRQYTSQIPMGVGGIRYSFANMFTEFGTSIISKFTDGPAKAYGLYPQKGTLIPGADADIVIYDDSVTRVISDKDSIYHNRELKGQVEQVYLRGELIVERGEFLGGKGKYVSRELKL